MKLYDLKKEREKYEKELEHYLELAEYFPVLLAHIEVYLEKNDLEPDETLLAMLEFSHVLTYGEPRKD